MLSDVEPSTYIYYSKHQNIDTQITDDKNYHSKSLDFNSKSLNLKKQGMEDGPPQ